MAMIAGAIAGPRIYRRLVSRSRRSKDLSYMSAGCRWTAKSSQALAPGIRPGQARTEDSGSKLPHSTVGARAWEATRKHRAKYVGWATICRPTNAKGSDREVVLL